MIILEKMCNYSIGMHLVLLIHLLLSFYNYLDYACLLLGLVEAGKGCTALAVVLLLQVSVG